MVTQGRRLRAVETKQPARQPASSSRELLLRGNLPPLPGAAAAGAAPGPWAAAGQEEILVLAAFPRMVPELKAATWSCPEEPFLEAGLDEGFPAGGIGLLELALELDECICTAVVFKTGIETKKIEME
nr:PREDICTED: E3 ubiquitin-protein ligase RNF182 isoform X2 [Macaca fascicularis]